MKIAFDAKRYFQNQTGLGNYSRSLIQGLQALQTPELQLTLCAPSVNDNHPVPKGVQILKPHSKWDRLGWREWKVSKLCSNEGVDLYHGLSAELPYGIEKAVKSTVVTIHDLIAVRNPELFPAWDAKIYRLKMRSAVNRATLIVATSEATRKEILETFSVPAQKVRVLYQSPSAAYFSPSHEDRVRQVQAKHSLAKPYFLSVGSIIERKKLRATLKAYSVALAQSQDLPDLVVIGNSSSEYARKAQEDCLKLGLRSRVHWLNPVTHEDLPLLTQGAWASLYPSIYEGFGIPIVEAQLLGVPVITSRFSCLPEVGGPGALCIDPDQSEEYANALLRIGQNQSIRDQLGSIGKARAHSLFSPQTLSLQLLEIYRELLR